MIKTPQKNLQGLITSAKRPWRFYSRLGYTNFVASSARRIIYTPPWFVVNQVVTQTIYKRFERIISNVFWYIQTLLLPKHKVNLGCTLPQRGSLFVEKNML